MKVAFALFALFAFSQAAHSYWYAGSTSTNATGLTGNPSPRATYAVVTAGACANGGAQTGYQKFTINATVPSFWYITGLVEYDLIGYSQLQVYTGAFDSANPCTNLLTIIDDGSTAPHLEDILWLAPGTYDVVITTTSATVEGLFAVHADSSKGQWNVQVTDNWVNTPYYGTATCQSYSSAAPYANFTFTPALNGNYDIFFFSYNSSDISPTFIATLYNGTVPFLGTGTSATPADPCTGASWVQSEYSSSSFVSVSKSYYEAAAMMNVALSNTTAYTVMLTGWNTGEYNAYGYWYRPTVFSALGDTANFLAPEVSGDNIDIPCTGDTAGHVWNSHVMTAVGYTTVVADIGVFPSGSSFDDQTCIYLGNNGGTKYTVAPLNCTGIISCSDYGNVAASGLLGQTYTIIETPYFSGATYAGEEYTLYIYTGLQLGPSPAPSTSSTGDLLSSSDASSVFVAASVLVAALLF